MSQKTQKKSIHWPTLNTVLMVESVLKNMDESVMNVAELKRNLPRQVNHNTLILILHYLEDSNKILVGLKGITWIHNSNQKLRNAIAKGTEI
ncbi:hypothetical protein LCGC14_2094180 [marine sediment metagenome]|uniref:Uncharacterized protein n=1 Tax=marine sediment metagenome TaxID=412755 RepID=A0A0F9GPX3_9ZZZZ